MLLSLTLLYDRYIWWAGDNAIPHTLLNLSFLFFLIICVASMQKRCMHTLMPKHTQTHTHRRCGRIFYSIPVLMRLVVRINTCQVRALVQYRRGQTVTKSGAKIIILITMPWRPPFIHQSTSLPPSVTPVSRSTPLSKAPLKCDWFPAPTSHFGVSLAPLCYPQLHRSIPLFVIPGGTISLLLVRIFLAGICFITLFGFPSISSP